VLLGHYSSLYAIVNGLWCIIFTEYWKHQEVDLAVRWGVRGISRIETKRKDFKHEKEVTDPITGEKQQIFPATKRLQRQALQIPFAIAAALVLGSLIATCFGIEIFISEIYNGPLKSILVSVMNMTGKIWLTSIGLLAHWYLDYGYASSDRHPH